MYCSRVSSASEQVDIQFFGPMRSRLWKIDCDQRGNHRGMYVPLHHNQSNRLMRWIPSHHNLSDVYVDGQIASHVVLHKTATRLPLSWSATSLYVLPQRVAPTVILLATPPHPPTHSRHRRPRTRFMVSTSYNVISHVEWSAGSFPPPQPEGWLGY